MPSNIYSIIEEICASNIAFWKFLTPNDCGLTGAHQYGILISRNCWQILFKKDINKDIEKGSIIKREADILWPQLQRTTHSVFTYYDSKHELRITRFQQKFPFIKPEKTGDLFVLTRSNGDFYRGYVISEESDIQEFLAYFNLSQVESNSFLRQYDFRKNNINIANVVGKYFDSHSDLPSSSEMSAMARKYAESFTNPVDPIGDPDSAILIWTKAEYDLFREFEEEDIKNKKLLDSLATDQEGVSKLISLANSILNRRKSRAGKSLEHHLGAIFEANNISFTPQATTEGKKRPDFIFPSEQAYKDPNFPQDKLFSLAAKTTCKDRWRQVISESDRIITKYLFTLQQGVSKSQLDEMKSDGVVLVVPEQYLNDFPPEYRDMVITLKEFISMIKESQK